MNIRKTVAVSFMVLLALMASSATVLACTGVYVGKEVSADGSVLLMRTEDMDSGESKRFIVHPAEDHKAGEYFEDSYGLKLEYPSHTYRYTAVPGSASRGVGEAPFGEAGFNELGVGATSTITAYPNEKALAADPYTENGLYELSVNDIILSRAATAREGIELVADIVDRYGSGEGNIIMIADQKEAWYMEIYTGHHYAAVRLPDDKAAVIPNAFMLGAVDIGAEDTIVSEGIVDFAEKNGILVYTDRKIDMRKTFAEEAKLPNTIRIWGGKRLLGGTVGSKPEDTEYTLFFTPSKKITVKDVMNVSRYRYEDTDYNVNKEENKYLRAIGTSRQEECNILQIRPDRPVETACLEWLCMGNSEFTAFVPYYAAAITDTPIMCKVDAPRYNMYSMYWASRGLSALCGQNRELYGNKVRQFFDLYENNLIDYVKIMDNKMEISTEPEKTANSYCNMLASDIFNKSSLVYQEVITFLANYEGRAEFEDNQYEFKPTTSSVIDTAGRYAAVLPTVVTVD